jgi:hypothetical protein
LKLVGELNTGALDEGLYFIETEGWQYSCWISRVAWLPRKGRIPSSM